MKTSEKTIKNSLVACTYYTFKEIDKSLQEKMTLLYGEKEDDYLPVTKTFEERYPFVKVDVIKGYTHMEMLRKGEVTSYLLKYLL